MGKIEICTYKDTSFLNNSNLKTRQSIQEWTKLILWKTSRPYPLKFFKGCLPQNLLSSLLNTLNQICFRYICWSGQNFKKKIQAVLDRFWFGKGVDGIITLCPGNIKRRTMGYFLGWFAFQIFYFHLNEFNLVGNCWISTLALDCLETNLFQRHRSSPPVVFLGKGVLKICSKFTGEHQVWFQ